MAHSPNDRIILSPLFTSSWKYVAVFESKVILTDQVTSSGDQSLQE